MTDSCARCGRRMCRSSRKSKTPGMPLHGGRGLCQACHLYLSNCRPDELLDYPRQTRSRDDLLDDYVLLRSQGLTWTQCAQRLGMTRQGFARAMQRARDDLDPRAGRPGETWPPPQPKETAS